MRSGLYVRKSRTVFLVRILRVYHNLFALLCLILRMVVEADHFFLVKVLLEFLPKSEKGLHVPAFLIGLLLTNGCHKRPSSLIPRIREELRKRCS